jgi:hypothetical protein
MDISLFIMLIMMCTLFFYLGYKYGKENRMKDEQAWRLIERAFYEGVIFSVVGSHAGGTTGALKEAKEYAEKLKASMPEISYAPWTSEEVEKLKVRQSNEAMHPYNCICGQELIPTVMGWLCPDCRYKQNWCHESDIK